MADKPGYNVASGFNGGVTVGINADSWEQFVFLCEQVWPGQGQAVARGLYGNLLAQSGLVQAQTQLPTETQAAQLLQSQLGAVPIPPNHAPQPQYQQQPPVYQAPPVQAQNGPPPGQTCDPNDPTKTKYVPAGVSKKTGKPYPAFWTTP